MVTQDLRARVRQEGCEVYLGKFKTPEEAREEEDTYIRIYELKPKRRKT